MYLSLLCVTGPHILMACLLYLNDTRRRVPIPISKQSHLGGQCPSVKGLKLRMGVQWACSVARFQTWASFPVQRTGNDGSRFSKPRLAGSECSGCPCAWTEKHLKGGQVDFSWGLRECSRGGECPVVAGTGGGWSLHDADQEAEGLDGKQSWVVTMPILQLRPLSHTQSQNFPV